LRLLGTIIVALLAITMAIFPISVPQAVASAAHQHALVASIGHEHAHEHAVDGDHEHTEVLASPSNDAALSASSDHDQGSQDCTGVVCCSMGVCHAFQVSENPSLSSPAGALIPMAMAGDEQVGGITASGLDKPPRTV
jgi:hypothetical protein